MFGLALLLGFAALIWLIVEEKREADEVEEFTDWATWDWPIPDDNEDWDFPEREAS
jgi:hypothetical protein